MNNSTRAWTAVGAGIATLVILAGCAQAVNGRAVAADVVQTSTSTSSSTATSSTATSTTDTGGGTRTNGTRTSTSESSTSESSSSSTSSTETSTSTSEREDPNVAPLSEDLLWSYRSFNSDWTEVTDEQGIHEYQYKQTQCTLGLYQPGGYLERPVLPTDAEIVSEYVNYVGEKFTDPAAVTVDTTGREFETDLNGSIDQEVPETILLAGEHVTFASDGGEAQLYGYRNADYALVVAIFCKGGEYPTYLAELQTKLDDLAVGLYY